MGWLRTPAPCQLSYAQFSMIQYADDLIFFQDDFDNARNSKKKCLFEKMSGLKINYYKSEFFLFGKVYYRRNMHCNLQAVLIQFFLEMQEDPRALHLDDTCNHFINYSHKTLQSHTPVRLKPSSRQQTVVIPIQLMKGC